MKDAIVGRKEVSEETKNIEGSLVNSTITLPNPKEAVKVC